MKSVTIVEIGEKMKEIAFELVRIKSVVGTEGEVDVAQAVMEKLKTLSYFQQKPEQLSFVRIAGDSRGRGFVKAVILADEPVRDTVLCLGHIDTVGIDDYGEFQHVATQPDLLKDNLKQIQFGQEITQALDSDNWFFGRGLLDMKTGVAAHIVMAEHFSGCTKELKANIVFLFVPDEEGDSAGMLAAVEDLAAMAARNDWQMLAAVDTDYMTDKYADDEHKYVYVGTVGKLLPSFFLYGEETHVGEAFNGLDANLLASEVLYQMDLSADLCDIADGEVTMPPVSLYQRDLKEEYSVQTANSVTLYFNYATHISEPDVVLEKCRAKAMESFQNVIRRLNEQYELYCRLANIPFHKLPWEPQVLTFAELHQRVREEMGDEIDHIIDQLSGELRERKVDDREYSLAIVREVHRRYSDQNSKIIVYFAPPYYPHIFVQGEDERERRLLAAVEDAIGCARERFDYQIVTKKFYPYISDLSFCSMPKDSATLAKLTENMPAWNRTYRLPVSAIQSISMPVVNIGPYGKDAHKLSERISQKYSFDAMPYILRRTLENLAVKPTDR